MADGRRAAPLTLYTEHGLAIFHDAEIAADKQKSVPPGHNLLENTILGLKGTGMRRQLVLRVGRLLRSIRLGGRRKAPARKNFPQRNSRFATSSEPSTRLRSTVECR